MSYAEEVLNDYWKKKVKKAAEISKEYGYAEQDEEFWNNQRWEIIFLVIDIYENK